MTRAEKIRQFTTIFSFVVLFLFSFVKVWQTMTNLEVLGENDAAKQGKFKVERVVDGDTFVLADGRKVRYIGIDTPETKHPQKPVECFGKEATQFHRQLILDKEVKLEADVQDSDQYGRLLRYVWLNDELINQKLVAEGYAVAASYPPNVKYQDRLAEAERKAREENLGLWGKCDTEQEK
jgi:micrococcal nuclease